jgi:hypothetical protein
MELIIKKILKEQSSEKALNQQEIVLFKYINKKVPKNSRKDQLYDAISQGLKMVNLNPNKAQYYFELYNLNYRPDGDYENITTDEFKGVKDFKSKKITNKQAGEYTQVKAPFKGSNLKGNWEKDRDGEEMYVVYSYNWYPIYIYKKGIWYEIIDTYSSSTSKHIRYSYPFRYNSSIDKMVVLVDRDEMEKLKRNAGFDDIMKTKKEKLLRDKSRLISKKPQLIRNPEWLETPPAQYKVKFRLTDIDEENDKVVVKVSIDDVIRREGNRGIKSDDNYTKGDIPNVTKEKVEKTVERNILGNMTQYLGSSKIELPIEFKFTHEKENK